MLPKNFNQSLECVQKAAQQLGWPFSFVDKDKVLLEVQTPTQPLRFLHNKNPFNNFISARICQDKSLQHQLYIQNQIPTPKTFIFHNPNQKQAFQIYSQYDSTHEIISQIESQLDYPLIIKKNISSLSKDVHYIAATDDLKSILNNYFQSQDPVIILAQEFVIGEEYRLVQLNGDLLLAYNKNNHKFTKQPLTPPQKVIDQQILDKFQKITEQIHQSLQINFAGIDLIIDEKDQIRVLETNPNPACFYYNKYNGSEDFIQIYLQCFQQFQN